MNDSSTSTSKIGSSIKESVPLVKVRKCKIYALRHALCAWRIVEAGHIRGFGKIPAQKLQLPELIVKDFSFAKIPQPTYVLDVQSLRIHFWLNSCLGAPCPFQREKFRVDFSRADDSLLSENNTIFVLTGVDSLIQN